MYCKATEEPERTRTRREVCRQDTSESIDRTMYIKPGDSRFYGRACLNPVRETSPSAKPCVRR